MNTVNRSKETYAIGLGMAVAMGTIVGGINYLEYNETEAIIAGTKQLIYSSLAIGVTGTLYEYFSKRVKTLPGELLPIIIPATASIIGTYLTHRYFKHEENPLLSTTPTIILAPLSMIAFHVRRRIQEIGDDIKNIKF